MNKRLRLKALAQEAQQLREKMNSDDGLTDADRERVEAISTEAATLRAEIDRDETLTRQLEEASDVEQGFSSTDADEERAQSLGRAFTTSEAMKRFRTEHRNGISDGAPVSVKAKRVGGDSYRQRAPLATPTTGNAAPVRTSQVDDLVYRPRPSILDLVTRGTTALPWFQYRQVISKTNNAAITPESVENTGEQYLKPLSTLATRTAEAREHTYADGMEVTNQELSDDGIIEALIDSTLRENLDLYIAHLLINGAGNEDEPTGLLNATGILQQDFSTDMVTTIRKSKTLLSDQSGVTAPQAVLLNPADDEEWDLLKDADGRYLGAGPFASGPTTAWGVPRIADPSIPEGTAIIGDFSTIHFLVYEALSILAFNQHKDYAQRNLVYIRAELRALQLIRDTTRLAIVDIKGA